MAEPSLTAARLRELLHYDPETGVFTWLRSRGKAMKGKPTGTASHNGYRSIGIDRKTYLAHRLAWLYVYGVWPTGEIDHKDQDRSNNRIANLRDVTIAVNVQNRSKANVTSTSGLLGAHWNKQQSCYQASIQVEGKSIYLGLFRTAQEAHEAYMDGKRRLHPGCLSVVP